MKKILPVVIIFALALIVGALRVAGVTGAAEYTYGVAGDAEAYVSAVN